MGRVCRMMFNFKSFWKVFLILNHVNDCQVYEDTILINLICYVKEAFENLKYGQFQNQDVRFNIFGLSKRQILSYSCQKKLNRISGKKNK